MTCEFYSKPSVVVFRILLVGGGWIAVGAANGAVHILEQRSGFLLEVFKAHETAINKARYPTRSLAVDGRQKGVCWSTQIKRCAWKKAELESENLGHFLTKACLSIEDQKLLAKDSSFSISDPKFTNSKPTDPRLAPNDDLQMVCSADQLVTASADRSVRVWRFSSFPSAFPLGVAGVSISADQQAAGSLETASFFQDSHLGEPKRGIEAPAIIHQTFTI